MTDVTTSKAMVVEHEGGGPPAIRLPVSQLDDVRRVLDAKGFRYWVSERYVSMDGGPQRTWIVFSHATDPLAAQTALDQAG